MVKQSIIITFLILLFTPICYAFLFKSKQIAIKNQDKKLSSMSTGLKDVNLYSSYTQSTKLQENTLSVSSWKLAILGFLLTVFSLTTFNLLTSAIDNGSLAAGFKGDIHELLIFDLRNGYTPTEVLKTLQVWGSGGRIKYLIIELIDCTFYHSGYRALFVVIINRLMDAFINVYPKLKKMKWLGLVPVVLALLDFTEDFFQILFTSVYQLFSSSIDSPTILFTILVNLGSFFNQIKWLTVRSASLLTILILLSTFFGFLFQYLNNKKDL